MTATVPIWFDALQVGQVEVAASGALSLCYAQSIAGKKRTPDMIAGRHWEAMAREIGYRPTEVRNRVQELVDKLVAGRVDVTTEVTALPGATEGYVRQSAEAVEANALRMAGRL